MLKVILFLVLFALAIRVFFYIVRIVPQTDRYVIEFLGQYKTTWDAGIHFIIPFFERVACKVSLKEQCADFEPQNVITKDNVSISVDSVVYFKIFDAKLFAYGAENPLFALENLAATTLRNLIGEITLDEALTSRDTINTKLKNILDEATDPWGISVSRVELKNIDPPMEIKNAMEKQMKAEREKREALLNAEAHQESVIKKADGDAKALVLAAQAEKEAAIAKAEGKAEAIRKIYEAEAEGLERLKTANVDSGVLSLKSLEALKDLGNGQATKLIIPTELTESVSHLSLASEVLGLSPVEPTARKKATPRVPVAKLSAAKKALSEFNPDTM